MRKISLNKDHYALLSASEICEVASSNMHWMRHQEGIQRGNGAIRTELFLEKAAVGDYGLVEQSERFLSEIEDQIPVTQGWRKIDDVVGAVPNVPSFLAGHPQCMRRRERVMKETAPLAIFMDLASSMSIGQDKILKRGIVLLALTRLLVEHRSVELWVGTSMGDYGMTCTAAWQIDTAPLDLARAAFHISDVSMSRLFGYATCEMVVDKHIGGFGHQDVTKLKEVAGWHDVIYVPAIRYNDPMVDDPVGWIKRTLASHVRQPE